MKTESAFWDASAIVPLCCRQASTRAVRRFAREHRRIVVWWGISVEIQSAFHRLLRENQITQKELAHAQKQIEVLRRSWIEVLPSEQLRGLRVGEGGHLVCRLSLSVSTVSGFVPM